MKIYRVRFPDGTTTGWTPSEKAAYAQRYITQGVTCRILGKVESMDVYADDRRQYLQDGDRVEISSPSFIYNGRDNKYTIMVSRQSDVRFKGQKVIYDEALRPYIEEEAVDVKV